MADQIYNDIQEKVKIKVLNTPMNYQGEIVFDFRNCTSLTLSLYPKFRTVEATEGGIFSSGIIVKTGDINIVSGVLKVAGIQVVGAQQGTIAGCTTGGGVDQDDVARTAINSVIQALRAHGLIAT